MTVRDSVLALLENQKGIYCSGQAIAQRLGVSRAAVWKAIHSLQETGYPINAVTNKGYVLSLGSDILSISGIRKYLKDANPFYNIHLVAETNSTNTQLQQAASEGAEEGYTLIAKCQHNGRGRTGKLFFSPADTGVYFSILLRPKNWDAEKSLSITAMAGVAMCRAIQSITQKQPLIKWVNDIYLEGKKVCGILTEGSLSMESGQMEHIILGVGINLYPPAGGFPKEFSHSAGTVFSQAGSDQKNKLVAEFLQEFYQCYSHNISVVAPYQKLSYLSGKQVTVKCHDLVFSGKVTGIDSQLRLIVSHDGTEDHLLYGDVQILTP